MIASQQKEVFRVLDLVSEEKTDGLQGLLSSVDIVTQEKVVGIRRETTELKKSKKIVVLAVNITNDLDRSLKLKKHWLRDEDLARAEA